MAQTNLEIIIDADGHIAEDSEAIVAHMPAAYREKARTRPFNPFPPFDHLHSAHLVDLPHRSFDPKVGPEEWLDFLQDAGVEATVLFPTNGIASSNIVSRDWAIDAARAYNDWLYATYLQRSPRFKGMGILPLQEPEAAVEELRRVVQELGMYGAVLPSNGLQAPPLGNRHYLPVYAEADRLSCCLAVHGGVHGGMGTDRLDPYAAVHALAHPFGGMISFASIIFNGIVDKFPNARFGFLEGGVAWLLMCLERFDRSYQTHVTRDLRGQYLKLQEGETVSEYVVRQIKAGRVFVGCEGGEPLLATAVQMVGSEPFMYSTDFPHEVNNETCKEELRELLDSDGLTAADKEAILRRNAEKFYRLELP